MTAASQPDGKIVYEYGQIKCSVVSIMDNEIERKRNHKLLLARLREQERNYHASLTGMCQFEGFDPWGDVEPELESNKDRSKIEYRYPNGSEKRVPGDVALLIEQFHDTIGDASYPYALDILPEDTQMARSYQKWLRIASVTPPKQPSQCQVVGEGLHAGACDSGGYRTTLAFHGTHPDAAGLICANGFKIGKQRPFVFTSPSANYSKDYTAHNYQGYRTIVGCRVIVYEGESLFANMYTTVNPDRVQPICVFYF